MENYIYKEFVTGDIESNRGKIFKMGEYSTTGLNTDAYQSIFRFDDSFPEYVNRTKAVKGYAGIHMADELPFDFDVPKEFVSDLTKLAELKATVVKFCHMLESNYDVPLSYLRICFSGRRGFEVKFSTKVFGSINPSISLAKVLKGVVKDVADGYDQVDMSIYHATALLRIPLTIHGGSQRYKIPLTFDELTNLTVEEIINLSKLPRTVDVLQDSDIRPIPALQELFDKWQEEIKSQSSKKPKDTVTNGDDFNAILNGVAETKRNAAAIKLCGKFIRGNFDESYTLAILRMWNEKNDPPLNDSELASLVTRAYNNYSEKTEDEFNVDAVYDFKKASQEYLVYAKNLDKKKVTLGFPSLDKKLRGLLAGETLCIQGKTGVGKSGLVQNIAHNYGLASGEPVLIFSMEMPITGIVERACQIEMNISGLQVEELFSGTNDELPEQAKLLFTKLPNVYIITKTGLDLQKIKQWIEFAEENVYHKKTGLVLIDYLGLIKGKGSNLYEQVSGVGRGMKDLAKELEVPIIFLTQINKSKLDFDEPDMNSTRDSGSTVESCDFLLSVWKEKDRLQASPENESINIGIHKNRKGGLGMIPVRMNRRTLKMEEDTDVHLKTQ